jgi:hypothetical protein
MSYKPLNKQQANEMSKPPLIPDGIYPFELIEYNHTDKYGQVLKDRNNENMTRIKVKIWDSEGKERIVFTNLYWGENNKMSYRTRYFAESLKKIELYESGGMYDKFVECLNHSGLCEIYTQKERPKNDGTGGVWDAKNDIRNFIEKETHIQEENKNNPSKEEFFDDMILF